MTSRKLLFYLLGSVLIGFFIVAPFGVAGAEALYQIATSTATFIPPSVTPTSQVFDCPVGTPAGWGTYTPSALWQLTCSNCRSVTTPTSTATITPFPTYNGVGTPPVGCTPSVGGTPVVGTGVPNGCSYAPTVTATSTPVVTATTSIYGSLTCVSYGCEQVNPHTLRMRFQGFNVVSHPYLDLYFKRQFANQVLNYAIVNFSADLTNTDGHGHTKDYQWAFEIWGSSRRYAEVLTVPNHVLAPFGTWNYAPADYYKNNYPSGDTAATQMLMRMFVAQGGVQDGYATVSVDYDGWFYISSAPIDLSATPTPSPTPTVVGTPYFDTGYCSTVAPVVADFGFDLFVPDGVPNCNIGWNEFVIGDYTVPAVQICLQPSKFGVVRMFGNDYEVGVYALAAAAAFFWRFLRTV